MKITYEPIGIMHCDIKDVSSAPRFYNVSDIRGTIEVFEEYADGLAGIQRHSEIVVLFHFHQSKGFELMQSRHPGGKPCGVFSLCSPMRPNPIGMSVLKLEKVDGAMLYVNKVDMLDKTPILDIKPYKPLIL